MFQCPKAPAQAFAGGLSLVRGGLRLAQGASCCFGGGLGTGRAVALATLEQTASLAADQVVLGVNLRASIIFGALFRKVFLIDKNDKL
jgi:hypothetical protein